MKFYLDFEKPIAELEKKISELRELAIRDHVDIENEIVRLEQKLEKLVTSIFSKLTPWQITQLSRHINRPYTLDYIQELFENFYRLDGDRNYADDPAIVGGLADFAGSPVMIIGHQKGRTTKEKVYRNFGMPRPEGYRKALRLMSMAERFSLPIITFIDTPGAYPGIHAEERGQAEAIAKNITVMSCLKVPIISVIIGEGGSGGALAMGVADKILMMEYSVYSVISPESCAAILWRDATKASLAARSLRLTAKEIFEFGVADEIIPEPDGGAHRHFKAAAQLLAQKLTSHLKQLQTMTKQQLIDARYKKYRDIGVFSQDSTGESAVGL